MQLAADIFSIVAKGERSVSDFYFTVLYIFFSCRPRLSARCFLNCLRFRPTTCIRMCGTAQLNFKTGQSDWATTEWCMNTASTRGTRMGKATGNSMTRPSSVTFALTCSQARWRSTLQTRSALSWWTSWPTTMSAAWLTNSFWTLCCPSHKKSLQS